jgi:hypothetical protein
MFYFTPLTGVLFTFPSLYLYTIGHRLVFSLGEWSPQLQTRFHVSGPTQELTSLCSNFRIRDYHPVSSNFPDGSTSYSIVLMASPITPIINYRFRLLPFRSPLLRESHLMYFPLVTEMFHFTRFRFPNL